MNEDAICGAMQSNKKRTTGEKAGALQTTPLTRDCALAIRPTPREREEGMELLDTTNKGFLLRRNKTRSRGLKR